jgi:hypothetical protein
MIAPLIIVIVIIIITTADASSGRRFGLPSSIHRQRPATPIFGRSRVLDQLIFLVSRGGGGGEDDSSDIRDSAWEEEIRRTREFYGAVVTEMRKTIIVAATTTTDTDTANAHASVTTINDEVIGSEEAERNVLLGEEEVEEEEGGMSDYEVEDNNIADTNDTREQIMHEPSAEEEPIKTVLQDSTIVDKEDVDESIVEETKSRATIIHGVAVEGSRVVAKEYNIILDNDDDDDDSDTNKLADNLELVSHRLHHRNIESLKPVEGIFSLDKSYTRGLFSWCHRMVQRRISSSLGGRHLKVVIPIVLTSTVGVVLSLLVATADKQGTTLLSADDDLTEEDETPYDR